MFEIPLSCIVITTLLFLYVTEVKQIIFYAFMFYFTLVCRTFHNIFKKKKEIKSFQKLLGQPSYIVFLPIIKFAKICLVRRHAVF